MKKCSRCKIKKSTKEFYKDLARKDSLNYWCKDCIKKHHKLYGNTPQKKAYDKKWISEHYTTEYWRNKYHTNINYKIGIDLRNRLQYALRGVSKSAGTFKLIGCTLSFFRNYFETKFTKGMSWEKVMTGEIHCDHIKPVASFDRTEIGWQYKCFNYKNLQPLWAKDNLVKSDKYKD